MVSSFFSIPLIFIGHVRIYFFLVKISVCVNGFSPAKQKCYLTIWYDLEYYLSTEVTLECFKTFWIGQKTHQVAHAKHLNSLPKMTTALGNDELHIQNGRPKALDITV